MSCFGMALIRKSILIINIFYTELYFLLQIYININMMVCWWQFNFYCIIIFFNTYFYSYVLFDLNTLAQYDYDVDDDVVRCFLYIKKNYFRLA